MMQKFHVFRNENGHIQSIETRLTGQTLLNTPFLNKETAFSEEEREQFELQSLLPEVIETLEQQVNQTYQVFKQQSDPLAKYLYLHHLRERNVTLYFRLVQDHLDEMMPIIYTPTVGEAIQQYSHVLKGTKGVFLSYQDKKRLDNILKPFLHEGIDLIIVTDSSGILGIGDQGIGGIHICIGKSAVYTLCAGIDPSRILPIVLDVGTNNENLLNDPSYAGWRHPRIEGEDYDHFIDRFVSCIRKCLPDVYLHWEDFDKNAARKNLNRYYHQMCTFNDDMQGTGMIALASILSAISMLEHKLSQQRIVFFGAGTAATGIADQIVDMMVEEGLSVQEARSHIWILGRRGLVTTRLKKLVNFQQTYARNADQTKEWEVKNPEQISLLEVIKHVHPTILIGCSTVTGAFNEEIVKCMAGSTSNPIIFSLSNPTSKAEAIPEDLIRWTDGKALIATGSPFEPVKYQGKTYTISQCNNAFVFPGLGLGVLAAKATRVIVSMLFAACKALVDYKENHTKSCHGALLPDILNIRKISLHLARAVIQQAIEDGVAKGNINIEKRINEVSWEARYYSLQKEV